MKRPLRNTQRGITCKMCYALIVHMHQTGAPSNKQRRKEYAAGNDVIPIELREGRGLEVAWHLDCEIGCHRRRLRS